jgi:homoserine O-succinyltransferase
MPVRLDRDQKTSGEEVVVGLVNNMPDAALQSTERQFLDLLDVASGDIPVRLCLFSLTQVPRSAVARTHLNTFYRDIGDLWDRPADGTIVTGAEPRTASLPDESYWSELTRLIDWAEDSGVPSVWSCLAAHAAVLHMDGVERRPLPEKRFGLFECTQAAVDPLMLGVAPRMQVPHSRFNELPEESLLASGYVVLTRSPEAGVDTFVKRRRTVSLFFQGHPEYDEGALYREYRRDVGRFLRGERARYPAAPDSYFDAEAHFAFAAFRERALAQRSDDLMQYFPAMATEGALVARSATPAAGIYANWLSHLVAQRSKKPATRARVRTRPGRVVAPVEGL